MKKFSLLFSLSFILLSTSLYALDMTATSGASTSPNKEKISYALGAMLGKQFQQLNINLDPTAFFNGLKDAMNGQSKMSDDEIKASIIFFRKNIMAKQIGEISKVKEKNKQISEDFLAKNKNQPGVKTLSDGLQYKVLSTGSGPKPLPQDNITVEYTGTTVDGKEFDSSAKHGKPMTAPLQYMIQGWVEALQMMNAGSTWELYIPANLAYGERGQPPIIGPNQALIFKVKLVSVEKNKTPTETKP